LEAVIFEANKHLKRMKKHYFLFSAAALCSALSDAQPVLTASGINPVPGDISVIKRTQDLSPGSSGANQTWNFSSMVVSATDNYSTGAVSLAPEGSNFPSANVQWNNGSVYAFWKTSSTALVNMGFDTPAAVMPYSNGEDFLHFPFSYNNSYSDSWQSIYDVSGFTFTRTGVTTVTYDGYGSLTTPAFNLSNVARVHFLQDYKDSSQFSTTHYVNDEYFWYVNGYHQPVASVYTLTFGSNQNTGGSYAGNVSTTVSLDELTSQTMLIAPNPASDKVIVGLSSGEALTSVRIFDLEGKVVFEKPNPGESRVELDVTSLPPGFYFAKVETASGSVEVRKVEVSR
jgi:hypothetical protein